MRRVYIGAGDYKYIDITEDDRRKLMARFNPEHPFRTRCPFCGDHYTIQQFYRFYPCKMCPAFYPSVDRMPCDQRLMDWIKEKFPGSMFLTKQQVISAIYEAVTEAKKIKKVYYPKKYIDRRLDEFGRMFHGKAINFHDEEGWKIIIEPTTGKNAG